ncbi:MAG: hypothetical protein A2V75_09100 [Actinobacteria bacterium RBG_16_70_17]|nr:MAG: hypothetical protein A2V75_09100 [Actinobacteria bacterium RBG_16_70_17]
MTRLTSPLLSLRATGTLASSLTLRRSPSGPQALRPPRHPDARTWPQLYHRWTYLDYVTWWTLLSDADRAPWIAAAAGHPITPLSAWLQDRLVTLPDLALLYHLDESPGPSIRDSSLNGNTGTAVGAVPGPGHYNRLWTFDGVDDRITVPISPSTTPGTTLTLEAWVRMTRPLPYAPSQTLVGRAQAAGSWILLVGSITAPWQAILVTSTGATILTGPIAQPNSWRHLALTWTGATATLYLDGAQVAQAPRSGTLSAPTATISLGASPTGATPFRGSIDEVRLYNRALAPSEIYRHAHRPVP